MGFKGIFVFLSNVGLKPYAIKGSPFRAFEGKCESETPM
jgi:hypothetical protein